VGWPRADRPDRQEINTYWRSLTLGASFAVHGAAYVRGHYVLSGISGGTTFALCLNLSTGEWSRFTNIDIFNGAARPSNQSQVFVQRWWDQTAAAPSMTNGQTVRLDAMFDPSPPAVGWTRTTPRSPSR
jgi:hypothetical protein